ncbi:MAG: VanZ family protein [Clostridia bacterium]|nr:VanZ family protein [Clostridia bacterium]
MIPDANSVYTGAFVTAFVLILVFLLPLLDRRICKRLGLNLEGGISANPEAEKLKSLRQTLLYSLFGVYLLVAAYLVFFSRTASTNYQVHAAIFEDLKKAVSIDFGLWNFVKAFFAEGPAEAFSHVRIFKPEDVIQVYMNVLLFVPMGYLLPYIFPWFRAKVRYRPVAACFLTSLFIENLQLVTRRGLYDLDDLAANTAGGFLGQVLFISVAYVVTHPDWRRELKAYRRWKKNARSRTLYPFARRMDLSRTVLMASREEDIWDYYVMKLGFRLKKQLVPLDSSGTDMLLEMGGTQVVVHCLNSEFADREQELTLSCRNLGPVIRRLNRNGIRTEKISLDPYTGLRCVSFDGPDRVRITIIEK